MLLSFSYLLQHSGALVSLQVVNGQVRFSKRCSIVKRSGLLSCCFYFLLFIFYQSLFSIAIILISQLLYKAKVSLTLCDCSFFLLVKGRFQKRFSGFCPLRGGGTPPCPLSFFEHNDCPLRGGRGYPPIPLRKKSAKKRLFLAKKR